MENERYIVEMVMTWSAIMIESLANHAIAENFDDKEFTIDAIENPYRAYKQVNHIKYDGTGLGAKIAIMMRDSTTRPNDIISVNNIVNARNTIVHDKPFELTDHGDGDVEINYYRNRGIEKDKVIRFTSPSEFYKDCDQIVQLILSGWPEAKGLFNEISFSTFPS